MSALRVVPLDHLDLAFAPRRWPFAQARRAEIDAHFAELKLRRPGVWNGRVLLLHRWAIEGATLHGAFFESDFASFMAWRDWGFPDATVTNCFAMGALRSSDGAFLLGVMGAHTANAGQIYFAAGTPDPNDIAGASVDLGGSVWREVAEETGLTSADLTAETGWHAVLAGPLLAVMRILQARERADALRARMLAHLASEKAPELSDIRIVRGADDLDPRMPAFVAAFLNSVWSGREGR
jgi:hypothetical protein